MKFGVNYTPSHGWLLSLLDPDWESIKADFDQIASLGVDHVRMLPVWPVMQPNRTWINPKAIADVRRMVDLAFESGLDSYVDVLQGHLSSFDFVPAWLVSWHERNMFTDADAVEAECNLANALCDALDDAPGFRGLTVGNECNQFSDRPHPRMMPADRTQAGEWLDAVLGSVSDRLHERGRIGLHSENDAVWYMDGHGFVPAHASGKGDVTSVHSWVFNGTAQHYGALSAQSTGHAAYLVELSKAFSADPAHQVWVQEIGAPQNVLAESELTTFCTESVRNIADCADVYGITWWCSHDVQQRFSDFPEFEHQLGLFDEGGRLKPIGAAFRDVIAECRHAGGAAPRTEAIVVPVDVEGTPVMRAALAPGGSLFDAWMDMTREGRRPTFVTSMDAERPEVLDARGVERVICVEPVAGHAYTAVSDPAFEETT
ncbi:glycoside hydrolase 5 family protein [Bifidobacterium adolescentis]|uniref:glycoside hydrolase 5 family protein n=1 Tax=Bifidobacterium adolescentis TaxID=1680 RepID=UPI000E546D42|nr:glycosyl hydrolase [Bifidobacterium adolescentis]RGU87788.1 glycosyl hydrolase [Bifidobacterium adolescentis]